MAASATPFVCGGGQAKKGSLLLAAEAAFARAPTERGEAREELVELWNQAFGEPGTSAERARANRAISKALASAGFAASAAAPSHGVGGKFVYVNAFDAPSPPPERRRTAAASSAGPSAASSAGAGPMRDLQAAPAPTLGARRVQMPTHGPTRSGPYALPPAQPRSRAYREEWWWPNAGAEVACDGPFCEARLPMGQMTEQRHPGQSRFVAWEWLCPSCEEAGASVSSALVEPPKRQKAPMKS